MRSVFNLSSQTFVSFGSQNGEFPICNALFLLFPLSDELYETARFKAFFISTQPIEKINFSIATH